MTFNDEEKLFLRINFLLVPGEVEVESLERLFTSALHN
jgi:hypothetical protein